MTTGGVEARDTSMELAEKTVVAGRFRLTRPLGRGGMGSVWHATHLGLDIPCAVKFIEGEMATVPEMRARFEREAKAAAQLRSPHVVQILDHGVWEGTPYIAMELLEGEDLGKRLARVGRMAPAEVHHLISQVCRALAKAHAVGIVHRDLKPDNVFIVRDDDRELAKVLDFGIAKTGTSGLSGGNTTPGAMLGTPYYMSPEQAQGTQAVDFRSDLWSVAVICFQALTGRLPFESDALGDLLLKIIVADLPTPSACGCPVPGFDAWWARAAARDPRQRFQSAKELSDALGLACGVVRPGSGQYAAVGAATPRPNALPVLDASGPPTLVDRENAPRPWAGTTPGPVAHAVGTDRAPKRSSTTAILGGGAVLVAALGITVLLFKGAGRPTPPEPTTAAAPAPTAAPDDGTPAVAPAPPPTGTGSQPPLAAPSDSGKAAPPLLASASASPEPRSPPPAAPKHAKRPKADLGF